MAEQFSFEVKFVKYNAYLYNTARKLGLNKDDAQIVVSHVWCSCFERMKKNPELEKKWNATPGSFEKYIFTALRNKVYNLYKKKKEILMEFKNENEDAKTNEYKPGEMMASSDEPEPFEFIEQTTETRIREFFKEAEGVLTDEERVFYEVFQGLLDSDIKGVVSKAARKLGLTPDQGHNIFRRIKRKIQDFEGRNEMLKDLSASAVFDLRIFSFFRDIFKKEEVLDEASLKVGMELSRKVIEKLGVDAISLFSKVIK